jgi:hypothetical protein
LLGNSTRRRELGGDPKVSPNTNKEHSQASLRHPIVGSIYNPGLDSVFAIQSKVLEDLAPNRPTSNVLQPRHILHYENLGTNLAHHPDELSIQPIATIIDDSLMITHLRKRLTRRAPNNGVYLGGTNRCEELVLDGAGGDVP